MSGLPGIVQNNCHSTRHKYQILHITTTAVHLSYRLLCFRPPNVAGKLISEAPYFRRFFLSIAEKRFFFYLPNVADFFFFAQNQFTFWGGGIAENSGNKSPTEREQNMTFWGATAFFAAVGPCKVMSLEKEKKKSFN